MNITRRELKKLCRNYLAEDISFSSKGKQKTATKKNVQDNTAKKNAEVIKMLDKKFELLDEINKRLKKVEERMGI